MKKRPGVPNLKIGIFTLIAAIIAAVMLFFFFSPLSYAVKTDSSDFSSLKVISVKEDSDNLVFNLPDVTLFEKTEVTIQLAEGDEPLKSVSQVSVKNNSSFFIAAGTNVKVENDTAYIIVTGYRQFIFVGPAESYGFAVKIEK